MMEHMLEIDYAAAVAFFLDLQQRLLDRPTQHWSVPRCHLINPT
jgi:hypothetical protein